MESVVSKELSEGSSSPVDMGLRSCKGGCQLGRELDSEGRGSSTCKVKHDGFMLVKVKGQK